MSLPSSITVYDGPTSLLIQHIALDSSSVAPVTPITVTISVNWRKLLTNTKKG